MSYLATPRLAFAGHFQVDVSTVNNTVGYFDNAAFDPSFQELSPPGKGGWNPDGTGFFRLVDCKITGAALDDHWITDPGVDRVIGMRLENADDRVFGKLVDLDPQQQMCSEIWGLRLRLTNGGDGAAFAGDYRPGAFFNLWQRQQAGLPSDQVLGAAFRSVLAGVTWRASSPSGVLELLRAASDDGELSIAMSVFGYGRDPKIPRYTYGKVIGSIGPSQKNEPKQFALGRQMAPSIAMPDQGPPPNYVDWFVCKVDADRKFVTADCGNCFQIVNADGDIADIGPVLLAVLRDETNALLTTVTAQDVAILGPIDYQAPAWSVTTAGIQSISYATDEWVTNHIAERPLVLLAPAASGYTVLAQETLAGLFLRADNFVRRLEPNQTSQVDFYATRYGKPLVGAVIKCSDTQGMLGATGSQGQPAGIPVPDIMVPSNVVSYEQTLRTEVGGKAILHVKAAPLQPPMPRGYIDGQLYGIGYTLADQPANTVIDPFSFISVLVFGPVEVPDHPTWYRDVQPIMRQYANLYPIMSKRLMRLDDYDVVVKHLRILAFAFKLPVEDPNHMPVTRDLSDGRRAIVLKWMAQPGPDGLPLKGEPVLRSLPTPPLSIMAPVAFELQPIQMQGKTAVLLELAARRRLKEPS